MLTRAKLSRDTLAHRQNARPNPSHRRRILIGQLFFLISSAGSADVIGINMATCGICSTWGSRAGFFQVRVRFQKKKEGASLSCLRRTTPTQKHPLSVPAGPYHEQRSKEKICLPQMSQLTSSG
jgi:hypothetical protein